MTIYATKRVRSFLRWQHQPASGLTGFNYGVNNVDVSLFEAEDIFLFAPFPGRCTFPGNGSLVMGNSQWDSGAGMLITMGMWVVNGDELSLLAPKRENVDNLQQDVNPAFIDDLNDTFGRGVIGNAQAQGTGISFPEQFWPKTAFGFRVEAPATTPVPISGGGPFIFCCGNYIPGVAEGFDDAREDNALQVVPQVSGQDIKI